MRTMLRSKVTLLFLVLGLVLAFAGVALADNVQNDLASNEHDQRTVTTNGTTAGTTTVGYWISATGGDTQPGCNASDGSPAVVKFDSLPAGVSASVSQLSFSSCGNANAQNVTFSSTTPGTYTITPTVADTGTGTYTTSNATFDLVVQGTGTNLNNVSGSGTTGLSNGSLSATLVWNGNNVGGKTVSFAIDKLKNGTFTTVCGGTGQPVCPQTNNTTGVATLNNVSLAGLAPGPYPLRATFAGDDNYAGATTTGTLTVNPACTPTSSVTTQPTDQTVTYGANSVSFTATANGSPAPGVQWQVNTGSGFTNITGANSGTLTINNPAVADSGKQYRAVFTNTCNGTNTVTSNAATLTVNKATATVTLSGLGPYNYDSDPHSASASTSNPAGLNVDITYNGSSTAPTDAGTYTVVGTVNDPNYKGSATGTLKINKVNATIDVQGYTGDYDGDPHGATGSATGVGGANLNSQLDLGETFTNAPGGTAHWTFNGGTNYNNDEGDVQITINKVELTVTADIKSKTYDANPFTAFTRTITGFVNSENDSVVSGNLTYGGTAVGAVNAGSYTITPNVSGLSATNYTFKAANGALTINKRPITVTADAQSKLFNDPDPAPLTYKVTSQLSPALVGTDTFTGALTRVTGEAVGQYDILQGNVSAGPNYAITYVGAKLTIGAWTLKGFSQPVDMDVVTTTGTTEALNTVKAGSTVPLKFEVLKGATKLTNTSAIKSFSTKAVPCPLSGFVADEIEFLTTGGTSLRYDTTAGQFIQNWQTPKKVGCHDVTMETTDSSKLVAHFQLR
jgi:hypothetical protein